MTETMEPMTADEQRAIEQHMGLLWKIARSMPPELQARAEPDDMVQEMVPVLLDLLRRYDPEKAQFSTWVMNNARWRLLNALRTQGFGANLKPPGANLSGVPEEGASRQTLFFDLPAPLPGNNALQHRDPEPTPHADLLDAQECWLQSLSERDRAMIERLFGLNGRERTDYTHEAQVAGLSREGVRLRVKKLLRQLAEHLGAEPEQMGHGCKRCGTPVQAAKSGTLCKRCRAVRRGVAQKAYRERRAAL